MNLLALTRTAQWIITTIEFSLRIACFLGLILPDNLIPTLVRRATCKLIRDLDGTNNCLKKQKHTHTWHTYIYVYIIYIYTWMCLQQCWEDNTSEKLDNPREGLWNLRCAFCSPLAAMHTTTRMSVSHTKLHRHKTRSKIAVMKTSLKWEQSRSF